MKMADELRRALRGIDRKGYPAYKSLAGGYQFEGFLLFIDHVQGDPFAAPSSVRVEVPQGEAGFPAALRSSRAARIALADFLTRQIAARFARCSFKVRGSGKSGLVSIARCGQEVLQRSACEVGDEAVTVRFQVGFPAHGRTVDAGGLEKILFDFLPACVNAALLHRNLDAAQVQAAVHLAEDQEELRALLRKEGLVAFVANGSILPRRSGVCDEPLADGVPFASPPSLERSFDLAHRGRIAGMAVPQGVTLVVGGGYHGKSTLLEALQAGVYNHIAGDGREFVVADGTAVKLRAEDGRSIRDVDISAFIDGLPNGKDTAAFSTSNASGSTSQAAAVVESVEAGCRLLLVDEDTSATNFMVRDEFMQQVIGRDKEPITPFLERVRGLHEQAGASTILVAGSSGAFFHVADVVIQMDCYRPVDITKRVRALCAARGGCAQAERAGGFALPERARPLPMLGDGRGGSGGRGAGRRGGRRSGGAQRERMKVRARGRDGFSVGASEVDVRHVEQIADEGQVLALAYLLRYSLEELADGKRSLQGVVSTLFSLLDEQGWKPFCGSFVPCGLTRPRVQEMFACLNRFRG